MLILAAVAGSIVTILLRELVDRHDQKKARQAACHHDWVWFSLYREGEYWNRKCGSCGKQEACHEQPGPYDHVDERQ